MKNNKIFIDGLGLVEGHFSGIGHYILGILRGLDQILDEKKLSGQQVPKIYVFIPYNTIDKFRGFGFKHLTPKRIPISFRYMGALWHRGKLPPIDLFLGKGRYLFTRFVSMPLLYSEGSVIIYDLSYELHREYSDEGNAMFLSAAVKKTLPKMKSIFVISNSVKDEVRSFYKITSKKVLVATPAVDQNLFYRRDKAEIEEIKRKYDIEGRYILALSNLEPRKNLDSLVDAYCSLPKKYTNKYKLLLVGVSGWKTDKLFKKIITKVEQGYDIIRPSQYVEDSHLPAIISGAALLAYPSHYEGFGIPPLEALACGTPVITSDNSSLPEAVGSMATMINSKDLNALKSSMEHYLDNLDQITNKSRTEGPEHVDGFSWKKSAQVYWDELVGDK